MGIRGRASAWTLGAALLAAVLGAIAWGVLRAGAAEAARFPDGTYAYLDDTDRLFAGAPVAGNARGAVPPVTGHHPIRISRDAARRAAQRGFVRVVLPDGTTYDVRYEREEVAATGDWTFVGRVDTPFGELASVLTFGPDGVFGTLPAPDGRLFHITTSHGLATIAPAGDLVPPGTSAADPGATDIALPPVHGGQVNEADPGRWPPAPVERATPPGAPAVGAGRVLESTASPVAASVIDLLGIYTTDLVALRGSAAAAETEYANLVAITNQAHADSGTGIEFRIVGLHATDLPVDVPNEDALYRLTSGDLPDGLAVHQLRDDLHADFVALVRPYPEDSPNCGIAWLNGGALQPDYASGTHATSVSNVAPCTPFVLAHELGHNLGSGHDPEAFFFREPYGAFPFSFGYREGGSSGFATVMAYSQGEPRIGRFSDPHAIACGGARACGTASADNRRSLQYMAAGAAHFRGPPGLLTVSDAHAVEGTEKLLFRVSLSSPAPAGGVTYRVGTRDGNATAGADYQAMVSEGVIPEGEVLDLVWVDLADDSLQEPDEHFELVVEQVAGASAARPAGFGRIRDDDPRVRISGKLRFPSGMEPPTAAVQLVATGTDGYPSSLRAVDLSPPLFEYDVGVVPGFDVALRIDMPAPFADVLLEVPELREDLRRDIDILAAARVRGRVLFDDGDPLPESVLVRLDQPGVPGMGGFSYAMEAWAPSYAFDLEAVPGRFAALRIDSPPEPFAAQDVFIPSVTGDLVQDIRLRTLPSANFSWYDDRQREWGEPITRFVGLWLSSPAPDEGVRITIASRDGTATAGDDFVAFEQTLVYAPGDVYQSAPFTVLGDGIPEGDEWLDIVVVAVDGVWIENDVHRFILLNDDHPHPPAADVDGNGKDDLAWHSAAGGRLETWSMAGALVGSVESHALPGVSSLAALADFNGDGAADWISMRSADEEVERWSSTYDASRRHFLYMADWTSSHPGQDWRVVGQGDLDANGQSDLFWESEALGRIMWWSAGFKLGGQDFRDLPAGQRFAAAGDLDGDGNADIVVREAATRSAWLWRGQAAGGFGSAESLGQLLPAPWNLVGALDIDGDGRDDLAFHDPVQGRLRWWLMDGATRIAGGEAGVDAMFRIAATGDYNGDGRADLVWRDLARTELVIWLGSATGFTATPLGAHPGGDFAIVQAGMSAAVSGSSGAGGSLLPGDLDADGRTDLAWFNRELGQFDWWRMVGGRRAGLRGQALAGIDEVLGAGDFDGDGRQDLLARAAPGGGLRLLLNRDGGFVPWAVSREPGADERLAGIADLDGDGLDDLLWRSDAGQRMAWWLMSGATATAVGAQEIPRGYRLVGTGDLHGDGRADLLWHAVADDAIVAWTASAGGFAATRIDAWPGGALFVSAGDFDGDGDADLAWHRPDAGMVTRWTMQGLSRIGTSEQPTTRVGMRAIAGGDFDGDGRADIAWRHPGPTDVVRVWRSTGEAFEEVRVAEYPALPVAPPRMAVGGRGGGR